jgi:hypothetical protein
VVLRRSSVALKDSREPSIASAQIALETIDVSEVPMCFDPGEDPRDEVGTAYIRVRVRM